MTPRRLGMVLAILVGLAGGAGAQVDGDLERDPYGPAVGGYSYPDFSAPPGFERDLNGNLRAQTPYGSNEFFDRQAQRQELQRQEQPRDFQRQWQDLQNRTERQRQGGPWCQGAC